MTQLNPGLLNAFAKIIHNFCFSIQTIIYKVVGEIVVIYFIVHNQQTPHPFGQDSLIVSPPLKYFPPSSAKLQ